MYLEEREGQNPNFSQSKVDYQHYAVVLARTIRLTTAVCTVYNYFRVHLYTNKIGTNTVFKSF